MSFYIHCIIIDAKVMEMLHEKKLMMCPIIALYTCEKPFFHVLLNMHSPGTFIDIIRVRLVSKDEAHWLLLCKPTQTLPAN